MTVTVVTFAFLMSTLIIFQDHTSKILIRKKNIIDVYRRGDTKH